MGICGIETADELVCRSTEERRDPSLSASLASGELIAEWAERANSAGLLELRLAVWVCFNAAW